MRKRAKNAITDEKVLVRRRKVYRGFLWSALFLGIVVICAVMYIDLYRKTPDKIFIKAGVEQQIQMNSPLSGVIYRKDSLDEDGNVARQALNDTKTMQAMSMQVDFDKTVTMYAKDTCSYIADLKLFGIIPFKSIEINVIDDVRLIPAGIPIGIYVETKGVLVIDVGEFKSEDGDECAPSKNILKKGDTILTVNEEEIDTKNQLIRIVEESNGEPLILSIIREEENFDVKINPKKNEDGEYKIGVWVRDSAQGIGTLTYVNPDNEFGALGHGVNDTDAGTLMQLDEGYLYATDIVSITKGKKGEPGELTGIIRYTDRNIMGVIEENTGLGIYGTVDYETLNRLTMDPIPIATKTEVEIGDAQIITTVNEQTKVYDIEITSFNYATTINREISIHITDEELLDLTGGIVQGMSGSPIIQNGRIVGAVTHVLVNDPTRGYGIFVENMLEH
ncbi:MAG: SpoIVB peptidase [Lachnospiraceae bacterium]|nr:SpoIVB peptidase [Lachnospiraceae bacterium]